MTDLFVFDVDNFLEAGKAANVANPANALTEQRFAVANDSLTVANVAANREADRPTLADISRTLANAEPLQEANISDISRGRPESEEFTFSAIHAAPIPAETTLADISKSLAFENRPQEPTLAGLATLATGQTAENDFSFSSAFPIPALPAELERLITRVARHYGCTQTEMEEIREAASRDMDGALTAYRAMAAEIETEQDTGAAQARAAGMALCRECSRLVAGRCMAARGGKIKGAAKEYSPVQGLFRRCPEYHARPYLNQSKVTNIAVIANQAESLTG